MNAEKALIINRVWAMPDKWTFKIKPISELIYKYYTAGWIDPFAGEHSPADITNDIEDRVADYRMDGLEFLKMLPSNSANGAFFDPPYSTEQCLRSYKSRYKGTAGRSEYWTACKNELARIIKPGGIVMSFGWNSCGIGSKRGFEIIEILLVCHGSYHYDTICTVERKETTLLNHERTE